MLSTNNRMCFPKAALDLRMCLIPKTHASPSRDKMLSGTTTREAMTGAQRAPSKNSRGTSKNSRGWTLMKDSSPSTSRPCSPAGSEAELDEDEGRGEGRRTL